TSYFKNVTRVLIEAGDGADTINLQGLPGIPITVDAGDGADTVNVEDTRRTSSPMVVRGGVGDDTLHLAPSRDTLDFLRNNVIGQGGRGDALPSTHNASDAGVKRPYTAPANTFVIDRDETVTYSEVEGLLLNMHRNTTINMTGNAPGVSTAIVAAGVVNIGGG